MADIQESKSDGPAVERVKGVPTPWRASLAKDGTWRVLRTTDLGWATRVEVLAEGASSWAVADDMAQQENGR